MQEVYKLKDGVKLEDFESLKDNGFIQIPNSETIIKLCHQELDSEPVQSILTRLYRNKEWINMFYKKEKKKFKEMMGLSYNKNGDIIPNDKFYQIIQSWFINIDLSDGWVGFTSGDSFDQIVFYAKGLLDKYFSNVVFLLMSKGLIEVLQVEE